MCTAQEYMVQWVAKLASAERDYRETLAAVARGAAKPPKNPTAKPSAAPTGRGARAAGGARRGAPAAGLGLGLGLGNREAADAAAAAAVAALEPDETDAWYLDALDLIMAHGGDRGDRAAEAVRDHLRARDQCALGGLSSPPHASTSQGLQACAGCAGCEYHRLPTSATCMQSNIYISWLSTSGLSVG